MSASTISRFPNKLPDAENQVSNNTKHYEMCNKLLKAGQNLSSNSDNIDKYFEDESLSSLPADSVIATLIRVLLVPM